jgi:hypothetical protein
MMSNFGKDESLGYNFQLAGRYDVFGATVFWLIQDFLEDKRYAFNVGRKDRNY